MAKPSDSRRIRRLVLAQVQARRLLHGVRVAYGLLCPRIRAGRSACDPRDPTAICCRSFCLPDGSTCCG
jgi:hypothetical protein